MNTKQLLAAEKVRTAELELGFKNLRNIARDCFKIASNYSGCIDGVEEHGGDDHEDPSCAIYHRLYYALLMLIVILGLTLWISWKTNNEN
jgi:hypothetical protein